MSLTTEECEQSMQNQDPLTLAEYSRGRKQEERLKGDRFKEKGSGGGKRIGSGMEAESAGLEKQATDPKALPNGHMCLGLGT